MKLDTFLDIANSSMRLHYFPKLDYEFPDAVIAMKGILNKALKAPKFKLPVEGRLLDANLKGLDNTLLRMPYPITTLEYRMDPANVKVDPGQQLAEKRALIVVDTEESLDIYQLHSFDGDIARLHGKWGMLPQKLSLLRDRNVPVKSTSFDGKEGTGKAEAAVEDINNKAIIACARSSLARGNYQEFMKASGISSEADVKAILEEYIDAAEKDPAVMAKLRKDAKFDLTPPPPPSEGALRYSLVMQGVVPKLCTLGEAPVNDDMADWNAEMLVVMGLIEALSCSNITIVNPNPQRKGKNAKISLPEDTYRVLQVEVAASGEVKSSREDPITGRRSPREHMKRGHIRRQWYPSSQEHRKIWINNTIVNPGVGGKVLKNYQLVS